MTGEHLATATTTVNARATVVWSALTDPAKIKQFLFGSDVTSEWKVGSSISYAGEWEGEPYTDHGTILDLTAPRLFRSTYFSPLGGKQDIPENYHTITWMLDEHGETTTVEVTQDNNESEDAARRAEANWTSVLSELKKLLEST